MEHILHFGINIDDDAIVKSITRKVEDMTIAEVKAKVRDAVFTRGFETDVQDWAKKEFNKYLEEHKTEILDMASKHLAKSMGKTKAVKEAVGQVLLDLS